MARKRARGAASFREGASDPPHPMFATFAPTVSSWAGPRSPAWVVLLAGAWWLQAWFRSLAPRKAIHPRESGCPRASCSTGCRLGQAGQLALRTASSRSSLHGPAACWRCWAGVEPRLAIAGLLHPLLPVAPTSPPYVGQCAAPARARWLVSALQPGAITAGLKAVGRLKLLKLAGLFAGRSPCSQSAQAEHGPLLGIHISTLPPFGVVSSVSHGIQVAGHNQSAGSEPDGLEFDHGRQFAAPPGPGPWPASPRLLGFRHDRRSARLWAAIHLGLPRPRRSHRRPPFSRRALIWHPPSPA